MDINLKNYSSSIDSSVSMAKIEKLLVEIGATDIHKQYENKLCKGITFYLFDVQLDTVTCFNLKANQEAAFKVLSKDVKKPRENTMENLRLQAERTSWKIISDWVEIQCSMILLGQAAPLQMFLPMVYDPGKKMILFELIISKQIKLLPEGK